MSSYTVEAVLKASGVSQFQQAFANAEESMKGFKEVGAKMGDVGKSLTKGITLPVMALGAGVMKVGKDYEASMSQVQAISGATGKDLDKLKETAREMGATTRYSASESADALGYMALAGWNVEEMTSALPGVLNLATAGNLDLAKASDIVTDMMSMFGMEAEEAGKASDIFAAAQSKSNTNVEQLSEALLNAGPAAAAAGADLEQTSAILGVFANQGVKGGRAGTALNAMYRDLKAGAEDGAIAIGKSSVAVYDANGNMRSMSDIMADVEQATEGMSDAQRDAALADVFKQQSLQGVNLLLNEGSDALKELEGDIYNSEGAAQDMADIMDNNLSGALANAKSALEEVALGFYDMAGGPMTTLVEKVTELIRWFGNLSDETKQWILIIAGVVAAIGPVVLALSAVITATMKVIGVLKLLAGALALLVSPVGAVIAIIGVFVGAIIYLWNTNEEFKEAILRIWNAIKNVLTTIVHALSSAVKAVWGKLTGFLVSNNELIRDTISTVWNAIKTIIVTAVNIISPVVTGAWRAISIVTSGVWNTIKLVISGSMNAILGIIKSIMQVITGDWRGAWNTMKSTVSGVISSVTSIIRSLGNINLFSAGKAIISGFVRGLKSAWESGKKFISGIGGWIKKNKGPISYDRRLLRPAGDAIIGGLNKGLQDSFPDVQRTVSGMAGAIENSLTASPTMDIAGSVARSNAQVKSAVSHEISNSGTKQPANLTVQLGKTQYRAFIEDINNAQAQNIQFESAYSL